MRAKSCQSSGFHAAALAAKGRRPRFWRELPDCWRHLTRLILRALLPSGRGAWGIAEVTDEVDDVLAVVRL